MPCLSQTTDIHCHRLSQMILDKISAVYLTKDGGVYWYSIQHGWFHQVNSFILGRTVYSPLTSGLSRTQLRLFIIVVGDGECIIHTALSWRNKAFGIGSSFAWAPDSKMYTVLEGQTKMWIYKTF